MIPYSSLNLLIAVKHKFSDGVKYTPKFNLSFFLNSNFGKREIKQHIKTSAGQFTINQTGLESIQLYLPPLHLQTRFAAIVEATEAQKALMQQSLTEMENNFNSLMQQAFRGELF